MAATSGSDPIAFTGDTHEYRITGAAEELWADVRLEGLTESWRPETGHLFFGPMTNISLPGRRSCPSAR